MSITSMQCQVRKSQIIKLKLCLGIDGAINICYIAMIDITLGRGFINVSMLSCRSGNFHVFRFPLIVMLGLLYTKYRIRELSTDEDYLLYCNG